MYWIDTDDTHTGSPAQRDFMCDTPDDIENLPTSSKMGVQQGADTISCQKCNRGSSCFCISPISMYFLNSDDEWVKAGKEA